MLKSYLTSLLALSLFHATLCSNLQSYKYSKIAASYLPSGIRFKTTSAAYCCHLCSKKSDCLSVNYYSGLKQCELISSHPTHFGVTYWDWGQGWSVYYKAGLCPYTWVLYRDSCYWFTPDLRTSETARNTCSESGAHLVELSDAEENTFIANSASHIGITQYWIGLTSTGQSVEWISGTPVVYLNFREGEPNNDVGNAFCIYVDINDMKWDDAPCSVTVSTVCEKPIAANYD